MISSAMIECPNLVGGQCTIALYMINHKVPVRAYVESCHACMKCDNPQDKNRVTCGLAILALSEAGVFSTQSHSDLLECTGINLNKTREIKNHPGTALAKILHDIGVKETEECRCSSYANAMDSWGWVGCFNRRQEIIDHMNAQKISWFDMLKVAFHGYFSTDALVDQALRISDPKNV